MVVYKQDGKWIDSGVQTRDVYLPTRRFRTPEQSRIVTQTREYNLPFTVKAQEFDITDWFNLDRRNRKWSLKPEYANKYDILKDKDGKIIGIEQKKKQFTKKYEKDDNDTSRTYSDYKPHDIAYKDKGLLKDETKRDIYTYDEGGDLTSKYKYMAPYIKEYKEWNDTQTLRGLQALSKWDTYTPFKSAIYQKYTGDRDWYKERQIRPDVLKTYRDKGLLKESQKWSDYKDVEKYFDDYSRVYKTAFKSGETKYDEKGRPSTEKEWSIYDKSRTTFADGVKRRKDEFLKKDIIYTYDEDNLTVKKDWIQYVPPSTAYFSHTLSEEETEKRKKIKRRLELSKTEEEKFKILEEAGLPITIKIPDTGEVITASSLKELNRKVDKYYTNYGNNLERTVEGRRTLVENGWVGQVTNSVTGESRDLTERELNAFISGGYSRLQKEINSQKGEISDDILVLREALDIEAKEPPKVQQPSIPEAVDKPWYKDALNWLNSKAVKLIDKDSKYTQLFGDYKSNALFKSKQKERDIEDIYEDIAYGNDISSSDYYVLRNDPVSWPKIFESEAYQEGASEYEKELYKVDKMLGSSLQDAFKDDAKVFTWKDAKELVLSPTKFGLIKNLANKIDMDKVRKMYEIDSKYNQGQGSLVKHYWNKYINPVIQVINNSTGEIISLGSDKYDNLIGPEGTRSIIKYGKVKTNEGVFEAISPEMRGIQSEEEYIPSEFSKKVKEFSKGLLTYDQLKYQVGYMGRLAVLDMVSAPILAFATQGLSGGRGLGDVVDFGMSAPDIAKGILLPTPENKAIALLETADVVADFIPLNPFHMNWKAYFKGNIKSPLEMKLRPQGKYIPNSAVFYRTQRNKYTTRDFEKISGDAKLAYMNAIAGRELKGKPNAVIWREKVGKYRKKDATVEAVFGEDKSFRMTRIIGNVVEEFKVDNNQKGELIIRKNGKIRTIREIKIPKEILNPMVLKKVIFKETMPIDYIPIRKKQRRSASEAQREIAQSVPIYEAWNFRGQIGNKLVDATVDMKRTLRKTIEIEPKHLKLYENLYVEAVNKLKKKGIEVSPIFIQEQFNDYLIKWGKGLEDSVVKAGTKTKNLRPTVDGFIKHFMIEYKNPKKTTVSTYDIIAQKIEMFNKGKEYKVGGERKLRAMHARGELKNLVYRHFDNMVSTDGVLKMGYYDPKSDTIALLDRESIPKNLKENKEFMKSLNKQSQEFVSKHELFHRKVQNKLSYWLYKNSEKYRKLEESFADFYGKYKGLFKAKPEDFFYFDKKIKADGTFETKKDRLARRTGIKKIKTSKSKMKKYLKDRFSQAYKEFKENVKYFREVRKRSKKEGEIGILSG